MELVESDQGPGCAESRDAEWPVGALLPPRVRLWFWVTSLSFVSLLEATAVVLWSSGWKPPLPRPLSGHLWAVLRATRPRIWLQEWKREWASVYALFIDLFTFLAGKNGVCWRKRVTRPRGALAC